MDQRTKVGPTDGVRVIVIDEDEHHANSTRSMLSEHKFYAQAYTSPTKALDFLKDHAQEVDLVLVAVHMEKEMHGFQFLEIVREAHKNLQVIMMSKETTMDTMKRCVELGACFLVNKPIDANTIHNLWQHVHLKTPRMDKIKHLLQGSGQKTQDLNYQGQSSKSKRGHITWTPYLHRKFLRALQILGEGACPRNIEIVMNVEGVNRKHIASHLQKYRKQKEAGKKPSNGLDTRKCRKGEDVPHDLEGSFSGNNVYSGMRRALQLGTLYDESQHVDVSSGDEVAEDGVDMMEDAPAQGDVTIASGDSTQVSAAETFCARGTEEILNKNSSGSGEKACNGEDAGRAAKLVVYSDSENDEIHEYTWL